MAQMRSADRVRKCLLFGVDRTYRGHHETDASDPNRTSRTAYSITSPVRGEEWLDGIHGRGHHSGRPASRKPRYRDSATPGPLKGRFKSNSMWRHTSETV
jgi:hypothetical protein